MQAQADTTTTGVYHNGEEVAVRSTSSHSRKYHNPKTDESGGIIFEDVDGEKRPIPACGNVAHDDTVWKLVPIRSVEGRNACKNCAQDDDTISERNAKGSGNITLARLAQRSDWEGGENISGNDSHIHSD